MPAIDADAHGLLDYVTVLVFAAAPVLVPLGPTGSVVSYVLAGVHLIMTLVTRFPRGVVDLVPMVWHGRVEYTVGGVLLVAPWLAGSFISFAGQAFFAAMGVVILGAAITTEYEEPAPS